MLKRERIEGWPGQRKSIWRECRGEQAANLISLFRRHAPIIEALQLDPPAKNGNRSIRHEHMGAPATRRTEWGKFFRINELQLRMGDT